MKIEEIYSLIADAIVNCVNEPWTQAILNVEYTEGGRTFDGVYIDNKGVQKNLDVNIPYNTSKSIKELHKITTEGGNNKWNRAKFTLLPDGNFNMEFKWDQALQDELEELSK